MDQKTGAGQDSHNCWTSFRWHASSAAGPPRLGVVGCVAAFEPLQKRRQSSTKGLGVRDNVGIGVKDRLGLCKSEKTGPSKRLSYTICKRDMCRVSCGEWLIRC